MPEDEVDRLYGLPLDEFTAARNELAKRLRKEGDKERADEVKALAKPSVAAWTVNQLARKRKPGVKSLLQAADALRKAQERALAGKGGDALRKAAQRERDAVAELRREARSLLSEYERPAPDDLLERVARTLSNAALDPEAREQLRAGTLTEEVDSSGFDAFAGMAVPSAPPPRTPAQGKAKAKPAPPKRASADARRRAAEERKRGEELRARARELEREAASAERTARRLGAEAERAAGAAEAAAAAAAEASELAESARAAADEARATARAAGS